METGEIKAVIMAILFAGDQVATEVRRTKEAVTSRTSLAEIKKRADGIWVEAKK